MGVASLNQLHVHIEPPTNCLNCIATRVSLAPNRTFPDPSCPRGTQPQLNQLWHVTPPYKPERFQTVSTSHYNLTILPCQTSISITGRPQGAQTSDTQNISHSHAKFPQTGGPFFFLWKFDTHFPETEDQRRQIEFFGGGHNGNDKESVPRDPRLGWLIKRPIVRHNNQVQRPTSSSDQNHCFFL